ncbi:hypothetical protein DAPPUDRAFT_324857 [Daphnia pulex]|uniref:Uncharacterized protein n=1 Tax=Daphnia pulex TaxID=6669 RepID=E9H2X9_DAPPU|nr:hypothetical protein DAPPUDRAFT_324857 [Daphnia pulex]|eukprot:EFX73936.1 hypothetical protein DAPPUDRAFT_324857 [Daphnia pulex]
MIFLDQCICRLASPSNLNQPDNQQDMDVFNSYKDQSSSIDDQMDMTPTTDLLSNECIPDLQPVPVLNSRPVRERHQTVCHSMLTILHGQPEPSDYQEAIASTEADLWQKLMKEEYD